MESIKKNVFEHVEDAGFSDGLDNKPIENPYKDSKYGFGKGFFNAWRRGYDRGREMFRTYGS